QPSSPPRPPGTVLSRSSNKAQTIGNSNLATTATTTEKQVTGASLNRFWLRTGQVGASQIIRRGARFVFIFVAARRLGPENFGVYAVLLAIVETLSLVSGEGLLDYLAREAARSPGKTRSLFSQITRLRWAYAAALLPMALGALTLFRFQEQKLVCAFL